MKTFFWRNTHFRKNAYFFRKFQAIFVYSVPTRPQSPLPLNDNIKKNYDSWWDLGYFHKASTCWKTH